MTAIENLHYAIGEMVFAIAKADGKVQKEEEQMLAKIVEEELKAHDAGFNISEIIFKILEKDPTSAETAYNWAITQMRQNSHYLSPELKGKFVTIVERVALACAPITQEEELYINRFWKDIAPLHGDPVYYKQD